jgi:hypothetical protein
MFIRPQILSLITTHQCTAACDHCCFTCTPKVTKAIPVPRLFTLIDEAVLLPSMRVVVFTGGECFLLGKNLDRLIAHANRYEMITRCVTNGYWARTIRAARSKADALRRAGLKEINFSTGSFHARYVPTDRIVNAAIASVEAGFTTLINAEICNDDGFTTEFLTEHPVISRYLSDGRLRLQRNVWIENAEGRGNAKINHTPERSRFNADRKSGCQTVLNVLAVTPDQHLVACCGLHLESIPDLHLGSVACASIQDVLSQAPDDFLKIWMHVDGPERILEFVRSYDPSYELPLDSVHPCTTCLHLYKDPHALEIIARHYKVVEDDVIERWLAGMAVEHVNRELNRKFSASAAGVSAAPARQ